MMIKVASDAKREVVNTNTTVCEECGAELRIGDFPICHGDPTRHAPGLSRVNGDECDVIQENGFRHPTRFTSKTALARALAEKGLEMRVRHVPIPGTDKSPHTTDWSKGSIDPYTLESARILSERNGAAKGTKVDESADLSGWESALGRAFQEAGL